MTFRIILILILLFSSAVFSCSETALFSLSRAEVNRFKGTKGKLAKQVIDALSNPRKLLVSILLGNELVNVAISILMASVIYTMLDGIEWQWRILIAVCISTILIVVVGEVIPKNIGIRFASFLAPVCAFFIKIFSKTFSPLRGLLLWMADKIVKIFGGDPTQIRSMIMEEEFRKMVDLGFEEGSLGEAEGVLIHNILDIGDKTVDHIMTPKEAIFSIPIDATIDQVLPQIRLNQFSRIPVYDANPDDVVGVMHIRDMFGTMRRRNITRVRELEDIIRPVIFVRQRATIDEVLREFQKLKIHMAIVVDSARRPYGIVTMDDIFDALFQE